MSASPLLCRRPRGLLFIAALAVLVQGALALVLACHAAAEGDASSRPTGQAPAVQAQAVPGQAPGALLLSAPAPVVDCPDCLHEDDARSDEPARGEEPAGAHAATADTPVDVAECTAHHPCQHGATETYWSTDLVVRAPDGPRDSGPAPLPSCLETANSAPPSTGPPSASSRVSAAVLAPVAVLCVDRN